MNQKTKWLGLDIGGITDEPSLVRNYVSTMVAIDQAIHDGGGEAVDPAARQAAAAAQADATRALADAATADTKATSADTKATQAQTKANQAMTTAQDALEGVPTWPDLAQAFDDQTYNWMAWGRAARYSSIVNGTVYAGLLQLSPSFDTPISTMVSAVKMSQKELDGGFIPVIIPINLTDMNGFVLDVAPKGLKVGIRTNYVSNSVEITVESADPANPVEIYNGQVLNVLIMFKVI